MGKAVYRKKTIQSGDVTEVEIYPIYPKPIARNKKVNKSRPAQQALNDKNRVKNLIRMVNANFQAQKDYFVTLTFSDKYLPKTVEDGRKVFKKYIQRLRRAAQKTKNELKWLAVIEQKNRLHFHLFLSGVEMRDIIDNWGEDIVKGKILEPYGKIDISPLMKIDGSFTALAIYHGKHRKNKGGCKSWTCSRNLKKPKVTVSDAGLSEEKVRTLIVQYDEKQLMKLLRKNSRQEYSLQSFEGGELEDYDDWRFLESNYQINDISGFYLYATYVRR